MRLVIDILENVFEAISARDNQDTLFMRENDFVALYEPVFASASFASRVYQSFKLEHNVLTPEAFFSGIGLLVHGSPEEKLNCNSFSFTPLFLYSFFDIFCFPF